jgi:glycosyltransferase involved in cell wall biosynthesis
LTAKADLWLCLLLNLGLSYYYSLPNRVFDYIQAGAPILASDFPEIRSVVTTYKTGTLINHYEPEYLAETINKALQENVDYRSFENACEELCWENEEKIMLNLINRD